MAKKVLNKDPTGGFYGLIQFSKTLTKNHASTPAHVHQPNEPTLPRLTIIPRLDKPTHQM